MGWNKKYTQKKVKFENGIKVGFWNKGGALQSLKEKVNEIEGIIKKIISIFSG